MINYAFGIATHCSELRHIVVHASLDGIGSSWGLRGGRGSKRWQKINSAWTERVMLGVNFAINISPWSRNNQRKWQPRFVQFKFIIHFQICHVPFHFMCLPPLLSPMTPSASTIPNPPFFQSHRHPSLAWAYKPAIFYFPVVDNNIFQA